LPSSHLHPCSNEQDADNFNLAPPLYITHQAFDIAACPAIDMATPGAGQLGVTAPLSVALPTEAELQASAALVDELKRQNNYESPAETNKRYVSQSAILDEPREISQTLVSRVVFEPVADLRFILDLPSSPPSKQSQKNSSDKSAESKAYPIISSNL
jgi:hypothetical protein